MKIRKSQPKNNKYYIRQVTGGLNGAVAGNPTIKGANVLCNCVGYANGRFNEIINDPDLKGINKAFRYQLVCNAENFIENAKRQGLKVSSKPTVGGIMVWQKGATLGGGDGAGHVEVVEEIYNDGSINCSSSGWNGWAFRLMRRNNSNGRWGQASGYKFRGCIINPSISGGEPVPAPKLDVDGVGGTATVMRMQEFFGTVEDGIIGGQSKSLNKYRASLKAVSYGGGGSSCVKKMQAWIGVTQDGGWGKDTSKALQRKLKNAGYDIGKDGVDGYFGKDSMKAFQKYLNEHDKSEPTPTPKPSKTDLKVIDISEFQSSIDWKKAKADGVKGAIVRCGFRGAGSGVLNEDSMFLKHIKGAYAAGIPVGIYMFTEGINAEEGRAEADYAVAQWKKAGVPLSFPIAVDTEDVFYTEKGKRKPGRANGLSKAKRTTVIKAFCDRIKELGYTPMIYASTSWLNNKLDMSKLPYDVWCAQYYSKCEYKGKYIIWQYTSEGSVAGVKGNVDMNHCYIEPKAVNPPSDPKPTPPPTPSGKGYTGKFPTYRLTKSNAEVKADACTWAKRIADNNDFHYGCGKHSHHNGCFYCGTQPKSKKNAGIKMWETTYCCNPFVGAAWAHGGGDATAYRMCHKGTSWDFGTGAGSYHTSKLFDNLGKPAQKNLKPGDVLCSDTHVALYIGNGKVVQAGHEDDNKIGSSKWDSSISVGTWNGWKRAYRYNGKVDCDRVILKGEYSTRVADMQRFLIWYGYKIKVTGFYNSETLKAVVDFQEKEVGKGQGDGSVGPKTIEAMKTCKK